MQSIRSPWKAVAFVVLLSSSVLPLGAQDKPKVQAPKPTVPEVFTLMGQFVRVAYSNEGFVTLGYRAAQSSVGTEWMLLDVGLTVREGNKPVVLKRDVAFELVWCHVG